GPPRSTGNRTGLPRSEALTPSMHPRDAGMIGGPGAGGGPAEPALVLLDGHVVDARLAATHQARLVELPQLVPVGPEPAALGVVVLVLEPDGDAVVGEGPERLDQPIVEFP